MHRQLDAGLVARNPPKKKKKKPRRRFAPVRPAGRAADLRDYAAPSEPRRLTTRHDDTCKKGNAQKQTHPDKLHTAETDEEGEESHLQPAASCCSPLPLPVGVSSREEEEEEWSGRRRRRSQQDVVNVSVL